MSAAVSEIRLPKAKKIRKIKEASNRVVMNLPAEYTWKTRTDALATGIAPAAMSRLLLVEGYRARGITPKMVRAEYLAYLATKVQAQANEEAAKAQAEADAEAAEALA